MDALDQRTLIIGGVAAVILIVLAAAAAGLFSSGGSTATTTATATTTQAATTTTTTAQAGGTHEKVTITGSGSSFIAPQMYAWADQIKSQYPWLIVEYESVGSGAGVSNFIKGLKDFGASDPPLPHDLWQQYQGKVIQMPVILGAVVVVYNIPEIGDVSLNFTGEVLARIYKGEIQYWDDPAIAQLNPAVKLPHEEIVAVHRSDASGTTNIFTFFLHKVAPDVWPEDLVGKTVDWPVDATGRGVGGKGNEGVASILKSTPYSIGYVEWSYAINAGLPMAAIQNAAGNFVLPTREAIQRAAAAAKLPDSPLDDFSGFLDYMVYSSDPEAYPIAGQTFLIFWTEYPKEKVEAIKKFIEYINTVGQSEGNIVEGYIPIPENVRQFNLKALDLIKAKG
ncbi:phosphate ABC transporter substrate-binding protein PstS [Stetteria hydrogenophila]